MFLELAIGDALDKTMAVRILMSFMVRGQRKLVVFSDGSDWEKPRQRFSNAMAKLLPYDLHWLEEPIFPPEDFDALACLGAESGIPIAAGENACTGFEFKKMFYAGAVKYAQP